jgi:hypothetical protein
MFIYIIIIFVLLYNLLCLFTLFIIIFVLLYNLLCLFTLFIIIFVLLLYRNPNSFGKIIFTNADVVSQLQILIKFANSLKCVAKRYFDF